MADTTTRQNNALISPDGAMGALRLSRKGELFTAGWLQAAIFEGKAFTATVGAFSTPVAGGGAAAILDIDRPRVAISVPSGKAILPYSVKVQCQVPLLATDADESEILLGVDKDVAAVAGTSTTETPLNLRTDSAEVSGCTCTSIHTADLSTAPTVDFELDRAVITGDMNGTPGFAAFWTPLKLDYQPCVVPLIVGTATLLVYWGGTVATTGFAQVTWVELNSSLFD